MLYRIVKTRVVRPESEEIGAVDTIISVILLGDGYSAAEGETMLRYVAGQLGYQEVEGEGEFPVFGMALKSNHDSLLFMEAM